MYTGAKTLVFTDLFVQFWMETVKADSRRYNFCLQLSHAISGACAARVMQKVAQTSCHSTLPIPTIVVVF